MGALAIVAFFVAIFAIILIHEAGHFLVARAYGFRVLEYFVGFGPRLWSFRRGEIEYGVKAIPAGLPPFDGGHLAVLAIEKIRGRTVDMRKVVPLAAAVMLLFGFFVISTAILDVVKPVPGP